MPAEPDTDQLLSTAQVAAIFNVTPAAVYHWRQQRVGPLPVDGVRPVRYRRSAVQAWITARAEPTRTGEPDPPPNRTVNSQTRPV